MFFINDKKYVKVWKVDRKEKSTSLSISTSEKKDDGYENSQWFARLVGDAHRDGAGLKKGDTFTIASGKITNVYKKEEGKSFLNVTIFKIADAPVSGGFDDFSDDFKALEDDDSIPF